MEKYKCLFCIVIWTFMPQISLADNFELSDVIREAREAQMKIAKSQIQQNIEQTKKQFSSEQTKQMEQQAVEKINPKDVMENSNK